MDAGYDDLWKRLGQLFRDAGFDGCTVIPFCPLSTFFSFKAFETGEFTRSEQDAIRCAILAFACVVTTVPSKPTLVSAIIRASEHKYRAGAIRALRTKLGIEPIVWAESHSGHRLMRDVQARIDEGIRPISIDKCP